MLILLIPLKSYAWDLSLNCSHIIPTDTELSSSRAISLTTGNTIFAQLSYEETMLTLGGQEAVDISLLGVGVGFKKDLFEIGIAYYLPNTSHRPAFREAMWLHFTHIYPDDIHSWYDDDTYKYNLNGNIGAYVGLNLERQLTDSLHFNFFIGYRYLKLQEYYLRDHQNYANGSWVEFINYRDFSAGIAMVGIRWEF